MTMTSTTLPLRTKTLAACLSLPLILPVLPTPAQAQDWNLAASLSSDYRLRGLSLSEGHGVPALDLGYALDTGWSFGLGLAALKRSDDARRTLLTASLARAWQWDDGWSATLGASHTAYKGPGQYRSPDYDEVRAGLQWRGLWSGAISYSPSVTGTDGYGRYDKERKGRAFSAELALRQPLGHGLALDAGLGVYGIRSASAGMTSYVYGNLGLAWAQGPVQALLGFIGSDAYAQGMASATSARAGWVGSLIWTF